MYPVSPPAPTASFGYRAAIGSSKESGTRCATPGSPLTPAPTPPAASSRPLRRLRSRAAAVAPLRSEESPPAHPAAQRSPRDAHTSDTAPADSRSPVLQI